MKHLKRVFAICLSLMFLLMNLQCNKKLSSVDQPLSKYLDKIPVNEKIDLTNYLYRRKITLVTQSVSVPLANFICCIEIDSLSLIRNSKLAFQCNQIYFTEEDGETKIPYWLESGCGEKITRFWLRIPSLIAKSNKTIYCYYSRDLTKSSSNFQNVFQTSENLIGWYYFQGIKNQKVIDFSGHENYGTLSEINYWQGWSNFNIHNLPLFYFNDWEKWYGDKSAYFSLPIKSPKTFLNIGSIESMIWLYNISEPITQRFVIDSGHQFQLGKLNDGKIYFQLGNSNNRIIWDTDLKIEKWYHLTITWNFPAKEISLFIDGIKSTRSIVSNKFIWQNNFTINELEFGGYSFGEDYGFSGYLDCLKVYDKGQSEAEVRKLFEINSRLLRFPRLIVDQKEEVLQNIGERQIISLNDFNELPISKKIKINLIYVTPMNVNHWDDPQNKTNEPEKKVNQKNIIDRFKFTNQDETYWYQKDEPIFGFDAHYCGNVGTNIEVKDSFQTRYIGIKMNDPSLIKNLKIEFFKYIDLEKDFGSIKDDNAWIDFFIPKAVACSPHYTFETVGESNLKLIAKKDDIYWYKIENPIFIDPATTLMQLSYLPSTKIGSLTLQLLEIVFLDNRNKLVTAEKIQKEPKEIEKKVGFSGNLTMLPHYEAYFPKVEKVSIDFTLTKNLELNLIIKNQGQDTVQLDEKSFSYLNDNLLTSIRVLFPRDNEMLAELPLANLKEQLIGKTILSGKTIILPILTSKKLTRNQVYYIAFTRKSQYNDFSDKNSVDKIISWIFGDNPYYWSQKKIGDNFVFYILTIKNDGSFLFHEPSPGE